MVAEALFIVELSSPLPQSTPAAAAAAMTSGFPGHQRNQSAGQHLIVNRQESGEDEEDVEKGPNAAGAECSSTAMVPPLTGGGIFPGGPSPDESPRDGLYNSKARRTRWDQLWTNRCSVLLAFVLFVAGSTGLFLAAYSFFYPENSYIGWWLVIPGALAFLPGAYHCFYITCTLCGRPGYDLDKLPTFKR